MPEANPQGQTCAICASYAAAKSVNDNRAHLISRLTSASLDADKSLDARLHSHVLCLALNFAHLLETQPVHMHIDGGMSFGGMPREQIKEVLAMMLKSIDDTDPKRN